MTGVIFATEREAGPFVEMFRTQRVASEPFPTWMCYRNGDAVAVVIVCGMGADCAARGAEHIISELGAVRVVNAGICGGVGANVGAGSVYRIAEVRSEDETDASAMECTAGGWDDLPPARLVTVDEPVFTPDRRRKIAEWGELVDMEGAAVARACQSQGIPCCMLKGVSDMADEEGKASIRRNIDEMSERLAEKLSEGLSSPEETDNSIIGRLMKFTKLEHTVFSLPLLYTGAWFGAGRAAPPLRVLALVLMAGAGARVLGMAMNRILDRKLDALNPRTSSRELPSGRMSLRAAVFVACGGFATYILACWLLGPLVLMLSPIPAAVLTGYSLLKRLTWLCHFGIGICLGMAPLGAFVAASGDLAFGPGVMLLAFFAFCWISGFDIIYGLQDVASDRRTGVHSIPAAFGVEPAQLAAGLVHLVAVGSAMGLLFLTSGGVAAWLVLLATVVAFICAYLPAIPLPVRFFPLSAIAGIGGALVPLLGTT